MEDLRAVVRDAIREADAWETLTAYRPFIPPRKEGSCCAATRDEYGRLCIGYCSPTCERRP